MEGKNKIVDFLGIRLLWLIFYFFLLFHPIQRFKIRRSLRRDKKHQTSWREEIWNHGPLSVFYSSFLFIEERVRWEPFESQKAQRRGFRVFRDNDKVIIEYYWERSQEALVRAKARRIALMRNHRLNMEAKICGFKNIDEIWILVLLSDWYRSLPEGDQLALEELLHKVLTDRRKWKEFENALLFFEVRLKNRDLQNLDPRVRWIIIKEMMAYVEGV